MWTEQYVDKREQGEMDGVDAIKENEEEHCLHGEEEGQFKSKNWVNEEEEEEDDDNDENENAKEKGDMDDLELEWEIAEFPSKAPQHAFSQHQYYKLQQKTEDGNVLVKDLVPQNHADMFRSHRRMNKAPRRLRLRHWQHFGSYRSVGFRLTQHWKSWRLRAQWICSQGHQYHRRWQRHNVHSKRKAIRRYQQLLSTDDRDDGVDENIAGFHRGTNTYFCM